MKKPYGVLRGVLLVVGVCLLANGGLLTMIDNLHVVFDPDGRAMDYALEEQVDVQVGFNSPAQATIVLPRTSTTELINGNSEVRITYGERVLFDGTCQKKQFADKTITLTAYDDLWFVDRIRRSFTQATADMTASEAVTAAFDQDSTFSDFTSAITFYDSSYSTPFVAGIDATSFVVPCDIAFAADEAFNGNNVSGLKFLDDMSKMAKQGDVYRYYYWLEYVNGQQYLHFEPEGWGYLWEWLANCSVWQQLTETFENLWNNIIVWGQEGRTQYPTINDAWTESDLNVWAVGVPTVTLSDTTAVVKQKSLKIEGDIAAGGTACAGISFTKSSATNGLDLSLFTHATISFYGVDADVKVRFILWNLNPGFSSVYYENTCNGAWQTVTITGQAVGAGGWTGIDGVGLTWDDTYGILIYVYDAAVRGSIVTYIDGIALYCDPIRSENSSTTGITTGYDATSIALYGERQATITNNQLYSVDDCNRMAQCLCNYFKDPEYTMGIQMPYFWEGHLNDRIKDQWYNLDHTFIVSKIKWSFTADSVTTAVNLGTERLSMDELIKKLYDDTVAIQYDNGNVSVGAL